MVYRNEGDMVYGACTWLTRNSPRRGAEIIKLPVGDIVWSHVYLYSAIDTEPVARKREVRAVHFRKAKDIDVKISARLQVCSSDKVVV